MSEEMIEIGKIVNTHGLRGEVKIVPWLDYPEVFEAFDHVYTEGCAQRYDVKSVRYQKANLIVAFDGVDRVEAAEKLKNKVVTVEKSYFYDLPDGTYLVADIIGLRATDGETDYGVVTDVFSTGSNDVYVIEKNGKKPLLLPIIDGVVDEVDLDGGIIKINIPDGLLDI